MSKPMIHQFTLDGYHLVLDVNSGTLHAVNELAGRIISLLTPPLTETFPEELIFALPEFDFELIREGYAEVYELYQSNTLFSEWDDNVRIDYETLPVKSLCLHVAHDCNMHCEYCFAGSGNYHGKRQLMSEETACSAIDFLLEASGPRRNLEVDFFGGEPLINPDVVKKTVEYARRREKEFGKNIRFTLTTNGLELDREMADLLNREMYNLVFSLDGRRSTHESMRHTNDNSESYDRILENIRYCVQNRGEKSWYVRGTYTHENLDFRSDVIALADEGFKHISIEPVVLSNDHRLAIREEDLPALFLEYERLAREIIHRNRRGRTSPPGMPFEFFHFSIDLNAGPCAYKRLKGCGSGTEYIAVSASGELYPCHQFVGKPEFLLGNVKEGITKPENRKPFCRSAVYENESCRDCFAKYFCSGGCAANNYNVNGKLDESYEIGCRLQRKRLECALMVQAAAAFDREEKE